MQQYLDLSQSQELCPCLGDIQLICIPLPGLGREVVRWTRPLMSLATSLLLWQKILLELVLSRLVARFGSSGDTRRRLSSLFRKGLHDYRGLNTPVLQVIGLVMAWLYWQKLNEIYSKLDTVDFRILEMRDFSFGAVDLSGAGWCWCLPREGGYIPVNAEEDEEEEGAVCHSKV